MFQLFFLVQREWLGIAQESRTTQASPRVDVDEAPYAPGNDLLYVTELEDAHDPIKLRARFYWNFWTVQQDLLG